MLEVREREGRRGYEGLEGTVTIESREPEAATLVVDAVLADGRTVSGRLRAEYCRVPLGSTPGAF
jgi:hypothetical protein